MPRLTDRDRIRALLRADPVWSVYALGDLAPGFFEKTDWFASDGARQALVMVYRGFDVPVLFAIGADEDVDPLLDEAGELARVYPHLRPGVLGLLGRRGFEIRESPAMWRMRLPLDGYRAAPTGGARRLAAADLPVLEKLYADGAAHGESPHFFLPSMVTEGAFFGLEEGGELVSAAGTHIVSAAESVAAIGNVYTRRDRRGRGLAAKTTSAVVDELRRLGIPVIILNVAQANAPAVRVYERLGFVRHCEYHEGLVVRRP